MSYFERVILYYVAMFNLWFSDGLPVKTKRVKKKRGRVASIAGWLRGLRQRGLLRRTLTGTGGSNPSPHTVEKVVRESIQYLRGRLARMLALS